MLLLMEESQGTVDFAPLISEGVSQAAIRHHSLLLKDAGLAVGPPILPLTDEELRTKKRHADTLGRHPQEDSRLSRLTWEGHEFLDAARDSKRWSKVMETVKELGGAVTFAGVKALLTVLMQQAIGHSAPQPPH